MRPQSNELTRGPPELVQHSVYRGSSHRRKSAAACPKFDMVWQYRSPIPVGRREVISSIRVEEGGGGAALCGMLVCGWHWMGSIPILKYHFYRRQKVCIGLLLC